MLSVYLCSFAMKGLAMIIEQLFELITRLTISELICTNLICRTDIFAINFEKSTMCVKF